MDEKMRIGKEIEKALIRKKMTLKKASMLTGVPKSTIHRWICGEVPTGVWSLAKLLKLLQISI